MNFADAPLQEAFKPLLSASTCAESGAATEVWYGFNLLWILNAKEKGLHLTTSPFGNSLCLGLYINLFTI